MNVYMCAIFRSVILQVLTVLFISQVSAQDSSLVGFWTFDDSTGRDSSVYANSGKLSQNPVFIEGVKGSAMYFDAIDDDIFIWDDNSLDTDSSMTISLWIMPDSVTPGGAKVMSKWYSSPTQGDWLLSLSSKDSCDGRCVSWYFGFANYGVYGHVDGWFSIGPPDIDYFLKLREWNFISVTFDTGLVNLYYNGDLIKTDTALVKYTSLGEYGTDHIYVGRMWNGHPGYNFKGGLDEIRIYNRSLSASEVNALYDQVTTIVNTANKIKFSTEFILLQNYPNPFNPSTTIKFAIPNKEEVKIEIFNALGQKAVVLVNKTMSAGYHEVEFNPQDLPSGVYAYKITAGQFQDLKKMLYLK